MSWFNNLKDDFDLTLPKQIPFDCDYEKALTDDLNKYQEKLKSIVAPKYLIDLVKEECDRLLNSITNYYRGDIPAALNIISDILDSFEKQDVIISDWKQSFGINGFISYLNNNNIAYMPEMIFYKARVSDKVEDYSAKDMIHIPFSKREKISSQRFSIPGLPCVYLGTSSYDCWLELNRPSRSNFNVSPVKLVEHYKILNLVSSWNMITQLSKIKEWIICLNQEKLIEELMVMWPLVCATSYKVENSDNRNFKSEYIISQLLMQVAASKNIDGICYYSKRIDDIYAFPFCINLALPAEYKGEKELSNKIQKGLQISRPINFEEFSLLDDQIKHRYVQSNFHIGIDSKLAGLALDYTNTEFCKFDGYLKSFLT